MNTLVRGQSSLEPGSFAQDTFSGLPRRPEHRELLGIASETFGESGRHNPLPSLSDSLRGREEQTLYPLNEWFQAQHASPMSNDVPTFFAPDPIVGILSAFCSIPAEYHYDLFNEFKDASEAKDLRKLLDTISDWAATAELYADQHLAQEVQQAISRRQGGSDWLYG